MPDSDIELSAHVPAAEYKEFKANFPQYGATKWLITSALREFNAQVRRGSHVRELIPLAIQEMLDLDRLITKSLTPEDSK